MALDWGMAGFEALGDDLGQLVLGAHDRLLAKARLAATRSALRQAGAAVRQAAKPGRTTTREAITQLMFEEYLNGLRDSGCAFEREQVWFGFVANAALRVGGFQMFLLEDAIEQGRRPSQVAKAPPEGCFEVVMAREAFKILHAA